MVPNTPSQFCKIRVSDTQDSSILDISEEYFAITSIFDNDHKENAKTFQLYQNYPNPFNPSTKINYSIPWTSLVILKVYDILGKEVATLINEEKSVGNYKVEFNASNLSSGIYFYRMQAGSFVSTKKFILLR